MKYYELKIYDKSGVRPIYTFNSDQGYHLETSIEVLGTINGVNNNAITLYNIPDITSMNLRDHKIELIAGYKNDSLLKYQGVNITAVSPKTILSGYIYSVFRDQTNIPDILTTIITNTYKSEDVDTSGSKEEKTIYLKNGDRILDFITSFFNLFNKGKVNCYSTKLQTLTYTKNVDMSFQFDPNNVNTMIRFIKFIREVVESISGIKTTITSDINGYLFCPDYYEMTDKEIKEIYSATDSEKISLKPSMLLTPPNFIMNRKISVQTILLPNIKVSSIINFNKEFKTSLSDVNIAYILDKMVGVWSVHSIEHNISYSDPSSTSFSSNIELNKLVGVNK